MQLSTNGARERWVSPSRKVQKPWGHEEIFALVDGKFCGKALFIKAGHALSLQYHERKEETIAVQSGRVLFEVGPDADSLDAFEIRPGDTIHVMPGTLHRMTAIEDSVLLEASTTEIDDVVRLDDRYGRTGTSAP
jgi:mannose-6-phosphate isomerase-like protein (cupin superfamily)